MLTPLGIDHMSSKCTDITQLAMFQTAQIAVARQRDCRPVNLLDAMYDVMVAINPSQHDMSHMEVFRLLQDNTLLAANDKRQHALSIYRQGNTKALAD